MKLRNLFYLLLALPLVFAACENGSEDVDKTPEYKAELKLTSESTMEFPAEGGDGEISFTAEMVEVTRMSPVEAPMPEAECDADWVTDLAVGEKVTFKVAANEGDARETKVVVTYDTESFEVVVKQAKKAEEPEKPFDGTVVELSHTMLYYYGDFYTPGEADNFIIILGDKGLTEDGWEHEDGHYYKFDTYTECIDKTNGISVPYGTYTLAAEYSAEVGVVASASYYTGDWEVDEPITEGTLTVSADGFVAEVVIGGEPYKLVCEGLNPIVVDYTENLGGDEEVVSTLTDDVEVNITGATVELDNLGDDYVWGCNNYLVYVSEDAEGETGEYMMFDILVPTTATTIAGTYEINDWEEPYTGYSGYYSDYDDEYYGCWYVNYDTEDMAPISDAELKIEIAEDGTYTFTIDGVDDAGYAITGTIVGKEAGSEDEGGEEPIVPSEPTAFTPVKVTANLYDTGNFILNLFVTDSAKHEFDVYDEVNPNNDNLSDGTYTSENGTIGLPDSYFYNGTKTVGMASAELTLKLNEDWTVTITGEFASEEGQAHTIDWTGVVEGFKYANQPLTHEYVITAFGVQARTASVWDINLTEKDLKLGEMFTRITVQLPEDNAMYITDGVYSVENGGILVNTSTQNGYSAWRWNSSGADIQVCEVKVANNLEAETSVIEGSFTIGLDTYVFKYEGKVDGFMYKELGEDGITSWSKVYVRNAFDDCKVLMMEASGFTGEFYLYKLGAKKGDALAAADYPVGDWEFTTSRDYCENGSSKANGVKLASGNVHVETTADGYVVTFDIIDNNGTAWKGTYTGSIAHP